MRYPILTTAMLGMLAGCASIPNGPSVAVMPAPGKSFEQFAAEDRECRQYAQQSLGTTASQAANESQAKSIAMGAAIGAVAGAVGGDGRAAGTGAAVGMLGGAAAGAGQARYSQSETQRRYDIAYEQCMYAKGNQLPQGGYYQPRTYSQPPASAPYPPPPPPSR